MEEIKNISNSAKPAGPVGRASLDKKPEQPAENIPEVEQSKTPPSSGVIIVSEETAVPESETSDIIHSKSNIKNMEVHHHGHVHETKKWKEYIFQFLMLFLAVFCGFLAENQREHYIENLRAKELIIPLLEDIREDTSALNTLIELRERQTKVLDTIRNIMKGEDWKQGSRKLYSLFRIYTRRQEFQNRNTTIDQLKNSGYLRYYKDQKLVSLIQQYIIDMQLVKDRQSRELQVMDNSIDPINSKFFDQSAFELPISEQDIIIPESSFMIRNLNEFRKDDFINQLIFLNGIRRINNSRVYNRKALESANKLLDRIALDFPGEVKKYFPKIK